MEFKKWLNINELNTVGTEDVDSSQIESIYDKAKIAVQLVRLYDATRSDSDTDPQTAKLLKNISTIVPLGTGAWGLYNSGKNRKVIGPNAANKIRFTFGDDVIKSQKINTIPNAVIKQHIPDIPSKELQPSDVISVNVKAIVDKLGDTPKAIAEIASTIVHEATHELEHQIKGKTDESGPLRAEQQFKDWLKRSVATITAKFPNINWSEI